MRGANHATAELMELGETETLRTFDENNRRVGNVDAHFHDRRRDEDVKFLFLDQVRFDHPRAAACQHLRKLQVFQHVHGIYPACRNEPHHRERAAQGLDGLQPGEKPCKKKA